VPYAIDRSQDNAKRSSMPYVSLLRLARDSANGKTQRAICLLPVTMQGEVSMPHVIDNARRTTTMPDVTCRDSVRRELDTICRRQSGGIKKKLGMPVKVWL
jgi:hypothetical protein